MKAKSLQDLGAIRQQVNAAALAAAAAEEARRDAERRAEAERNLFTHAVGHVKPIAAIERVDTALPSKKYVIAVTTLTTSATITVTIAIAKKPGSNAADITGAP